MNQPAHERIPLWPKLLYGSFLCALVPVYWHHYGPANFLWASDLALFLVFVSLWTERPLLNSMMVIGVLPFELVWTLDLLSGARLIGMVDYMFEADRPLYLRLLSLFHVALPVVMFLLLRRLGYDRRALVAQTLLAWVVLPVTYLVTDPVDNVNLVFGFGHEPQTSLSPLLHLALEMVLLPLAVFLPMHLVLKRLSSLFGPRSARGGSR